MKNTIQKISGSGRLDEKELEPWDASEMNGGIDIELDGQIGWDADEMFTKNERNFGVQSTFDDSLSDYTVGIDVKDTAEFREAEAKAERLAMEIESNPSTKDRLNLENGDEEALFAAVERPERANIPQQQHITPSPSTQQQSQQTIIIDSVKVPPPVVSNKTKSAVLPPQPGSMNVATTTNNVNTQQGSNQVSNTTSNTSSVSSSSNNKGTSTLPSGEKYIPPQQKRKPIPPTNNKNMSRITSSPNNIPMGQNNSKNNYPTGHQSSQNSGPPQYATYNVHG